MTEYSDLTSEALANGFSAILLVFFPEQTFPASESPNFSIFCNLDRLRISQISSSGSLLLNSSSLILSFSFHILL